MNTLTACGLFSKTKEGMFAMKLTLDWLLTQSTLQGLKLLTCHSLTSTQICGVNIMDNPDTVQWIKPGELILTTGYIFVGHTDLQKQIPADLKKAGCAALCIKSKRFFDEIPPEILESAEQAQLPIIELPYQYSLSDISEEISRQLYHLQFEEIASEQSLFNELFNGYFQKKPLSELLEIVAQYLGCPVFILDKQQQNIWSSQSEFAVPLDETPSAVFPFSNPRYSLCIYDKTNRELPVSTLTHVVKILDFSRVNIGMRSSGRQNYYDSFFQFVMNEENFSESTAIQISEYYGFPYPCSAICVLLSAANKHTLHTQEISAECQRILHNLSITLNSYFLAWNQNLICLCFFDEKSKSASYNAKCFVASAQKELFFPVLFGISRPIPRKLPDAFQEASFMLSLSRIFPDKKVFFFHDYLIFHQIAALSEDEKNEFYTMTVKPLVDFDRENHTSLTETLQKYFECHLNSSLAASKLYIHRNTFLNRMEKIQSLIDFHPDDPHNLFSIYYGLCIYLNLS